MIILAKLVLILLAATLVVLLVAGLVWAIRRTKKAVDYKMLPESDKEAIKFEEQIEWHEKVRSRMRNAK
jgi:hypothetical protein